jgi:hypothetical protein
MVGITGVDLSEHGNGSVKDVFPIVDVDLIGSNRALRLDD